MTTLAPPTADLEQLAHAGKLAQNAQAATIAQVAKPGLVLEPKYDGWRILAQVTADGVRMWARSGQRYDGKLPHVDAELRRLFPPGTWLDGEAVAVSIEDGRVAHAWGTAQSVMTTNGAHPHAERVSYVVFDLIAHGGIDARAAAFADRRKLLEQAFDGREGGPVMLTVQTAATEAAHAKLLENGFEGSVVKNPAAKYASGKRGHGWFKVKPQTTVEGVIVGFKPGEGGITGLVGAIVFAQHDDSGKLIERGRAGSGMTLAERAWITEHADDLIGTVVEVAHHGAMKDGLRHPVFVRLRPDRDAKDVTLHDA